MVPLACGHTAGTHNEIDENACRIERAFVGKQVPSVHSPDRGRCSAVDTIQDYLLLPPAHPQPIAQQQDHLHLSTRPRTLVLQRNATLSETQRSTSSHESSITAQVCRSVLSKRSPTPFPFPRTDWTFPRPPHTTPSRAGTPPVTPSTGTLRSATGRRRSGAGVAPRARHLDVQAALDVPRAAGAVAVLVAATAGGGGVMMARRGRAVAAGGGGATAVDAAVTLGARGSEFNRPTRSRRESLAQDMHR